MTILKTATMAELGTDFPADALSLHAVNAWASFCRLDRLAFLVRHDPFSVVAVSPSAERMLGSVPNASRTDMVRAWFTPESFDSVLHALHEVGPIDVPVWSSKMGLGVSAGQTLTIFRLDESPLACYSVLMLSGAVGLNYSYSARVAIFSTLENILEAYKYPAWILDVQGRWRARNSAASRFMHCLPFDLTGGAHGNTSRPQHWHGMAMRLRDEGVVEEKLDLGENGVWKLAFMFHPGPDTDSLLCLFQGRDDSDNFDELLVASEGEIALREREKAALAREIHDSLGQKLTVLRLSVDRLRREFDRDRPMTPLQSQKMQDVLEQLDATMEASRRIATNLRQDQVSQYGVAKSANQLVLDYCRRCNLQGRLEIGPNWLEPDLRMGQNLYRMLQEMLNNIAKHAKASRFMVRMDFDGQEFKLEVADDGVGMPEYVMQRPTLSIGMRSLRERAEIFGGVVVMLTRPDVDGTMITIHLPDNGLTEKRKGSGVNELVDAE